jgi:Cu/Ag efflux protein CusF
MERAKEVTPMTIKKSHRILAAVFGTLLAGSSAALAQPVPGMPSQPPEIIAAPAPSAMPGAQEVQGTIKSMDQAKKRITLEDGTMLTLSPSVKMAPAALKKGARISAVYEEKDGEKVVTSLRVEQPSKS